MEFNVRVTETRQKIMSIEAGNMAEAKKIAQELYNDNVFNLEYTRYKTVSFETLNPHSNRPKGR